MRNVWADHNDYISYPEQGRPNDALKSKLGHTLYTGQSQLDSMNLCLIDLKERSRREIFEGLYGIDCSAICVVVVGWYSLLFLKSNLHIDSYTEGSFCVYCTTEEFMLNIIIQQISDEDVSGYHFLSTFDIAQFSANSFKLL